MVTNSKPVDLKIECLVPFGQPCAVRVPKRKWRFDLRSELGVYLGTADVSVNGGLIYYPSTRAFYARGDIVPLQITPQEFERYSNIRSDTKQNLLKIPELSIQVSGDLDAQPTDVVEGHKLEPQLTTQPIEGTITRRKIMRLLKIGFLN